MSSTLLSHLRGRKLGRDRFKFHANIARFHKAPLNGNKFQEKNDVGINRSGTNVPSKDVGVTGTGKSYVHVMKGNNMSGTMECDSIPAIVLDDECLYSKDLSKSLLGRVKEFASLSNLKTALMNEGFVNIKIQYMGELWVLLEFPSTKSKELIHENVEVGSWVSVLRQASIDFTHEGRIVWVEIECIPFKLWSGNTFKRIAAKWEELLDVDDLEEMCFHSKRLCLYTKSGMNIFEKFKVIFRGKVFWICAKEVLEWVPDFLDDSDDEDQSDDGFKDGDPKVQDVGSCGDDNDVAEVPKTLFEKSTGQKEKQLDDPFGIYSLLNKKDKPKNEKYSDHNLKYPSGFTPNDKTNGFCMNEKNVRSVNDDNPQNYNVDEIQTRQEGNSGNKGSKMSKLDRFLISENLLITCPNIGATTLDRYLSDHRPILIRETQFDYGPVPFRFFHHWTELEGFNKFVIDTWSEVPGDNSNAMRSMMRKLKYLKVKIREWNNGNSNNTKRAIEKYKRGVRGFGCGY
nr:glucose-methanol-choline oxidoreductase, FAD/NAD(P)-binding domain protein [Tanacetum cinerariifolium]